jgi:PEGA domain
MWTIPQASPELVALLARGDGAPPVNGSSTEVYADSAFVGSCPVTLKLKPGQHTVRVTQSGCTDWSRDISVQAGSIAHLNAKGEKATAAGTVALESTKVSESGSTPPRSVSTESKATSPDRQASRSVSITSDPNGASLFVDSIGQGQAPVIVKLPPGKHSFQLVMAGYKDWTSEVEVRSGSITNVSATLQK